jgi:hypothetical protein
VDGVVLAAVIVAALVVVASVARGVARYRSVMRRSWPKVPPGEDDDDEW